MPLKLTKPLIIGTAIICFIAAVEGVVQIWRLTTPISTAPVFYWKQVPLLTEAPPPFGRALKMYRADRGAEQRKLLPGGQEMTFFYFEWDRIDFGPFSNLDGHSAEVCNVDFGSFKLMQNGGLRTYTATNGETLQFNYTLLASPNRKPMHVYKMAWLQGFGYWVSATSGNRITRLWRTALNFQGAGRILQAGLMNAANEEEAWYLFQSEVLGKLEWKHSSI